MLFFTIIAACKPPSTNLTVLKYNDKLLQNHNTAPLVILRDLNIDVA